MPNYTPDEYRAQVMKLRNVAHSAGYDELSLESGITGGMLMLAAQRIEAMQKIIDDDEHRSEFWRLWCAVYDGPLAWDGRDAFEEIQHLGGFSGQHP
jgi:hypothetical protein